MFDKDIDITELIKKKKALDAFTKVAMQLPGEPVDRLKIQISQKTTDIGFRLAETTARYVTGTHDESTLTAVRDYLQLVEIGINTFLASMEDGHHEE